MNNYAYMVFLYKGTKNIGRVVNYLPKENLVLFVFNGVYYSCNLTFEFTHLGSLLKNPKYEIPYKWFEKVTVLDELGVALYT